MNTSKQQCDDRNTEMAEKKTTTENNHDRHWINIIWSEVWNFLEFALISYVLLVVVALFLALVL